MSTAENGVRVGVVGLGKMGLSHLSLLGAHPLVSQLVACDSSTYVLDMLGKHAKVVTYSDYAAMLDDAALDAVVIATPTRLHEPMVRAALERGVHVFCEKPFVLEPADGSRLVELAESRGLVNQVGYHNRFVGAFAEAKRLLDLGAIGTVSHVLAEAYGPVVLRPSGSTWRSRQREGGGCVYDYAAHPIDLLTWYLGEPTGVTGTVLGQVHSRDVDDEVYSTIHFDAGRSAQLSVNWSDGSQRRMSTKLTIWGSDGRIYVDRQEIQLYLRPDAKVPDGYDDTGWTVRYTTELTKPVWFYLRGEEYSAQLDHFVRRAAGENLPADNSFADALVTDRVIGRLFADAAGVTVAASAVQTNERLLPRRRARWFGNRRAANV